MSVILYNILHPTVFNDPAQNRRSHDTQVTGFGFYRTVDGGTTGLLIERYPFRPFTFASNGTSEYSTSSPGDAAHFIAKYGSPGNVMLFQPFLPFYDYPFNCDMQNNTIGYTSYADKGAIAAGGDLITPQPAPVDELCMQIARTLDEDTGTFVIFDWELDTTVTYTMHLGRSTYLWEGTNSWQAGKLADTYVAIKRIPGVGFAFWDVMNTSPYTLRAPGLDGETETNQGHVQLYREALRTNVEWNAFRNGVAPLDPTADCFGTQAWEDGAPQIALDPESAASNFRILCDVNDPWPDQGGGNSEDTTGRRGTFLWEIEQYDIIETAYWAFHDITSDDDLGAAIELDNDVPVGNNIAAVFQEHMFLAGDPDNPHYLYWSKRFRPESWPLENFVEIGTAADPIRSIQAQTGVLGVFTSNTKYRIQGNATAGFIHDEAVSHRGAPAPKSIVSTDKGVFFVARDGVFITNFLSADEKISDAIDPLFLGIAKNSYNPINLDSLNEVAGGFYKNKYYFSYPSGTSTQNDHTAIFSFDTKTWTFWNVGYASFYAEDDTNLFLAGGYDSLVYIIENPEAFDDVGTEIGFSLQTGDFTGSAQTTRNLFLYYKVDAECSDDEITATFFVDDVSIQSHTITGSRTCPLLRLPENTFGNRWRVSITATTNRRIAVHGVTTVYLPLLAAA